VEGAVYGPFATLATALGVRRLATVVYADAIISADGAHTDPTSDPAEHRRQLDEALAILADAGVQAEPIAAIGNPVDEIITAAESRGVDLIVIGSQGMSAVRRFPPWVGRRSRRAPRYVRRARRGLEVRELWLAAARKGSRFARTVSERPEGLWSRRPPWWLEVNDSTSRSESRSMAALNFWCSAVWTGGLQGALGV
jgi:hypothetical protein